MNELWSAFIIQCKWATSNSWEVLSCILRINIKRCKVLDRRPFGKCPIYLYILKIYMKGDVLPFPLEVFENSTRRMAMRGRKKDS